MLAVQLIPITITGFVLKDVYIIATRTGTLGIVLTRGFLLYGMFEQGWNLRYVVVSPPHDVLALGRHYGTDDLDLECALASLRA